MIILTKSLSRILLCKPQLVNTQVAYISGKAFRTVDPYRPKPWPYEKRGYYNHHAWFDSTTKRFDENTKVIFVEGMPAIGKTDFAKTLADELEMKCFPMVTTDEIYMTKYGDDLRDLDPKLPESIRSYDEKHFCRDPKNPKNIILQIHQVQLKAYNYNDALAHLFNTGQGVVVERSPYGDFAFAEAMFSCGYLTKEAYNAYCRYYKSGMEVLMKPHLVIYLDAPNEVVLNNLKKRGQGEENALTLEFLEVMEEKYKFKFLKDIEEHAEILIYDWSEPGDVEVIVEDIERIDFDKYEGDKHHPKMKDWRWENEWDANERRWHFTSRQQQRLGAAFNIPIYDVPAIYADPNEYKVYEDLREELKGQKYSSEFNEDVGDSIIFKLGPKKRYESLSDRSWWR